MKYSIILICIILSKLSAEIYSLSQKPFIDGIASTDKFERGTYLIIVAEGNLEEILIDENIGNFIYFKKTQGYDVEVWNFEEIGSAESLRDSLEIYFEGNNLLEYVLLIGDNVASQDVSQIESFTIASYNEDEEDVTDYPFTFFPGGDSLKPNYFIGRWSISRGFDLKTIQRKTIQYLKMEDVQDSSYLENALIVGGGYKLDSGSNPVFPFEWPISPIWTSIWLQDRLSQHGYTKVDTAFFYIGNRILNNPIIPNAWNNGVGIINYRGWGNRSGWEKPKFGITEINNLYEPYVLPVVFSFVCNTGDFGNQYIAFGEALIRAGNYEEPTGAVAMIGPSDLDTDTRFNNVLCGALWDGLLEGRTPELAQALHAAKQAVAYEFDGIEEEGNGVTQNIPNFYHHIYGVLGDPSLPVWLGSPARIVVLNKSSALISDTLNLSDQFINIQVHDFAGNPLQDVVGALLYNGDLIAKGLSTSEGYLDIDFSNIVDIDIGEEMELYLNKAQFFQNRMSVVLAEENNDNFVTHSYGYQIPESTDYYHVDNVEYDWVELNPEIDGQGDNLYLTDDTIVRDIPIGFDFIYYGYTYSTINICSNGWAAFENSYIPYFENYSIPFPMGPSGMLAVFMDDLDDNGKEPFFDLNQDNIYDPTIDEFLTNCGDDPSNAVIPCHDYFDNNKRDEGEPFNVFKWHDENSHRFIVQWDELSNGEDDENCNDVGGCVKETFQMILHDPLYQNNYGQGNIVFQYKEIHDIDDGRIGANGNLSTIGIESPDQNQGVQYLFNGTFGNGTKLADLDGGLGGTAIKFSAKQEINSQEGTYLTIEEKYQPFKPQLVGVYPNPFNPVTTISYILSDFSWIDVSVFDIRGRKVTTLYHGNKPFGVHSINWNALAYSSGVYFITLSSSDSRFTQKVLLLK